MAYITCEDLSIGYDGNAITEHIHFKVNPGEYLYIIGENGAGKSTLVKTILHLINPVKGAVVTGDGLRPHEVGYLSQQTQVQKDFPATPWEIVLSGMLARSGRKPFYSKEEKACVRENMEKMEVWELRKKCYRHLSGGQQQRVLLARALCATQKLLLLDEPVSGLDPKVTAEFYQMIEKLNQEGTTILMVSHDMQAAVRYASHILHIGSNGQLFFGKKEEYLESEAFNVLCGKENEGQ